MIQMIRDTTLLSAMERSDQSPLPEAGDQGLIRVRGFSPPRLGIVRKHPLLALLSAALGQTCNYGQRPYIRRAKSYYITVISNTLYLSTKKQPLERLRSSSTLHLYHLYHLYHYFRGDTDDTMIQFREFRESPL